MSATGSHTADFVILGGGVMGLNIARELKTRYRDASVLLVEKEDSLGRHASGRNSGVLHAGFYYSADSMKARLCRAGNQLMSDYCAERGLRVNRCGKLVLARDSSDLQGLDELQRRAHANGVALESITAAEAKKIEPRAQTWERALYSPTTATVDPVEVMQSMARDAAALGVTIWTGTRYLERRGAAVVTSRGVIDGGYVINAAGLYADRIAKDFGFSERYRILPFKGLYLYARDGAPALATNLYPVPDLKNPFLGVHFTLTVDGHVKIGPTAIPCLWREQYDWTSHFRLDELVEVFGATIALLFRAGFDFRGLAREEMKKYHRPYLVSQASTLASGVRPEDFTTWGPPGIRAQLLDVRTRTLVMDFCVEGDDRSFHVLNAVSPGWTCAIPFARHVCDQVDRLLHGEREHHRTGSALAG